MIYSLKFGFKGVLLYTIHQCKHHCHCWGPSFYSLITPPNCLFFSNQMQAPEVSLYIFSFTLSVQLSKIPPNFKEHFLPPRVLMLVSPSSWVGAFAVKFLQLFLKLTQRGRTRPLVSQRICYRIL